jgi:hypothetical protein
MRRVLIDIGLLLPWVERVWAVRSPQIAERLD